MSQRKRKTTKKKNYTPYLVGAGALLLLSGNKSQAATGDSFDDTTIVPDSVIVRNHDSTWDYKYENGKWYTKRKTSSVWKDMKASLSPSNYQIAISRLSKYIK